MEGAAAAVQGARNVVNILPMDEQVRIRILGLLDVIDGAILTLEGLRVTFNGFRNAASGLFQAEYNSENVVGQDFDPVLRKLKLMRIRVATLGHFNHLSEEDVAVLNSCEAFLEVQGYKKNTRTHQEMAGSEGETDNKKVRVAEGVEVEEVGAAEAVEEVEEEQEDVGDQLEVEQY